MVETWRSMDKLAVTGSSLRGWIVRRRLYRTSTWSLARVFLKKSAIRVTATVAGFMSMLLIVWAAAVARVIADGGLHALRTLDTAQVNAAAQQAARVQSNLLPVLIVWAALLLLTPSGCGIAFLAAAVLAGTVGYLGLTPPPFLVTSWVSRAAHALFLADTQSNRPVSLGEAAALLGIALVLLVAASRIFLRLDDLPSPPKARIKWMRSRLIRELAAVLLITLVLSLIIWAGTVVRLAASGGTDPDALAQYGSLAGLEQGHYLLAVIFVAVVIPRLPAKRIAMRAATLAASAIALVPAVLAHTPALRIPVWTGQLARLGGKWGVDSLWSALFGCAPLLVLGIYLAGRLLRSREIRLN